MNNTTKIIAAILLALIGVLFRLIPHAANFTPVVAIALVAGVYLGRSYSLVVPLATMFVSDIVIGFYSLPVMLSVYGSFALIGVFGQLLRKYHSLETRAAMSIAASLFFFLVTNWAVWQFGSMYAHSLAGLGESYTLALPFFRNALVGDVFFSLGLFGAFELALRTRARRVALKKTLA